MQSFTCNMVESECLDDGTVSLSEMRKIMTISPYRERAAVPVPIEIEFRFNYRRTAAIAILVLFGESATAFLSVAMAYRGSCAWWGFAAMMHGLVLAAALIRWAVCILKDDEGSST